MERIKSRLFLDYCCFFYLLVWPSCTQGENKIKEMFEGTESVPFVALSCDCVFLEFLQSGRPTPLLVPQHIKIQTIYGDDWQALNESK